MTGVTSEVQSAMNTKTATRDRTAPGRDMGFASWFIDPPERLEGGGGALGPML